MATNDNLLFGRLRLKQLNLIIAIDQHRSLRKAAAELSMTQSTASKALQEAESILGNRLFERRRDGLYPNRYGDCAVSYAHTIRKDVLALSDELSELKTGSRGRVKMGVIMGSIPGVVRDAVNAMNALHRDIVIELHESTSAIMLAMLDSGQLDLVVGRTSVSADAGNYDYIHLSEEEVSIVAGPNNPLARRRALKLRDLKDSRWISYPNRAPLNILLKQELERADINVLDSAIETSSTFMTIALLSDSDDLVALLPTGVAHFFAQQGTVKVLPIELPSRSQPYGVIAMKHRSHSRATKLLLAMLLDKREARG